MIFDECWSSLISHQGKVFHTTRGMPFTFTVQDGALHIDRKKNMVQLAFTNATAGPVPGTKALRCFGSSYL